MSKPFVPGTKPIDLTCSCCDRPTRGRQWHNRDTGYGLCTKCATWLEPRESAEAMQQNYGTKGIHYAIVE